MINCIAPCPHITHTKSSFIKIRLNLTEKKQLTYKSWWRTAHPVNPSFLLTFGHSEAKNIVTSKSRLGITHHMNLCMMCTSLKYADPGLSFCCHSMGWVCLHSLLYSKLLKKAIQGNVVYYGHSRLSKWVSTKNLYAIFQLSSIVTVCLFSIMSDT